VSAKCDKKRREERSIKIIKNSLQSLWIETSVYGAGPEVPSMLWRNTREGSRREESHTKEQRATKEK